MSFYEADTPAVYESGKKVAGQPDGAIGLAQQFLRSIDETCGNVHHVRVQRALDAYRDAWHRPVYEVALEIDSLGNNTSASAVTIAEADQDAHALLATHAATVEAQTGLLSRPIV